MTMRLGAFFRRRPKEAMRARLEAVVEVVSSLRKDDKSDVSTLPLLMYEWRVVPSRAMALVDRFSGVSKMDEAEREVGVAASSAAMAEANQGCDVQ